MSNKPTFIAYQVEDGGQGEDTSKGHWTEVGAAWPHKDGKGYSINLRAHPVDGRQSLDLHPASVDAPVDPKTQPGRCDGRT